MITGDCNGIIRAVNLFPNKVAAGIGEHGEEAIDSLAVSHHANLIASVGMDLTIRVHPLSTAVERIKRVREGIKEDVVAPGSFFEDIS